MIPIIRANDTFSNDAIMGPLKTYLFTMIIHDIEGFTNLHIKQSDQYRCIALNIFLKVHT